jgi:hypothetical protein
MNTQTRLARLEACLKVAKPELDFRDMIVVLNVGEDGKTYRDDGTEWTAEMEAEHDQKWGGKGIKII